MASQAKTNNSVPFDPLLSMTRKNGVAFCANHEIALNNYLKSFVKCMPTAHIVSASRISNGRIAVYMSSRDNVEEAVLHGFHHDNQFIEITPLVKPATRIVFSNVYPEIPNFVLADNISDFCKLVSPIRPISLGIKEPNLSHVVSFRRQAYALIQPNITIPEHINLTNNGVNYRVFLSTESAKCFNCGEVGHFSKACKKNTAPTEANTEDKPRSTDNPLAPPPVFIHSKGKSDSKHPAKKSKTSKTPEGIDHSKSPRQSTSGPSPQRFAPSPSIAHPTDPTPLNSKQSSDTTKQPSSSPSPHTSPQPPKAGVDTTGDKTPMPQPFWSPPAPSRQNTPLFSNSCLPEAKKGNPRQRIQLQFSPLC